MKQPKCPQPSNRISTESTGSCLPSPANHRFWRKPAQGARCSPRTSAGVRTLVSIEKLVLGSLNFRCFLSSLPVEFLSFSLFWGEMSILFSSAKPSSGSGRQSLGLNRRGWSTWCRTLPVLMGGSSCLEQRHLQYLSLRLVACDVPNTDGHGQRAGKDC